MVQTVEGLEGDSLLSKVDNLSSAMNELNLKSYSSGNLKLKQDGKVEEDSDKDSGHESVSDNEEDEKDTGRSPCMSNQPSKNSAALNIESFTDGSEDQSPVTDGSDSTSVSNHDDNTAAREQDKADRVEEQCKAAGGEDAGDESDEDNESVVFPNDVVKTSTIGAGSKLCSSSPADEVIYQERGPCKVPRAHSAAARYNPMQDDFLDTSPFTDAEVSALQLSPLPGYDTPTYSSPDYTLTPGYNADYSSSYFFSGLSQGMSYSSSNSSPPTGAGANGFNYGRGIAELDDLSLQLNGGNLLTANYLDALDSAVAKTVEESGSCSSEDENSSVRFIMDSLRCIDKTELDYISPLSPGPSHTGTDLEQELDLSSDPWPARLPSPSPPLYQASFLCSPSSAYADSAPNTPGHDGPEVASAGYNPVISEQEAQELSKAAVKAIKKKCSTDVILRAAKRVSCQRAEDLCRKDPDGDTFFMIVVCKPSDSPNFYENLFVMQQHLQKLRVCCDQPIDGSCTDCCSLCGAGPDAWRTPLSETNNAGDSVLSCAVKMGHPDVVINFLCAGVACCPEDVRRVFDDAGRNFLAVYSNTYPVLKRFL